MALIKPKVRFKNRGPDQMRKIRAACERARGCSVTVGWMGNESYPDSNVTVGQVAIFNEFGTYNRDGSLHTPARPFMRPALDENEELIDNVRVKAIDDCAFNGKSVTDCLSTMGFTVQELIRNKIKSNVAPELADSTIKSRKKRGINRTNTLVDSGKMLNSLTFRVHLTKEQQEHEDKTPPDAHGSKRAPQTGHHAQAGARRAQPGRDEHGRFLKRVAQPGRDAHGRFLKRTPPGDGTR